MRPCLVIQRDRLAQHPLHGRGPRLPLLEVIRRAQPAQGRQGQHRGGQAELELASSSLLDRPRFRHRPLTLRRPQSFLHPGQVGRDPPGDDPRIAGTVVSASEARQSLASAISSASAPQPSSRATASAVSPRIAMRNTSA